MKKKAFLLSLLFTFSTFPLFTQSGQEVYLFSRDIAGKIEKDTLPYKYQIGATEYANGQYFRAALETWDHDRRSVPTITQDDSLNFERLIARDAKEYIVQRAKNEQMIIVNEAHHNPMHRAFTASLLQGLYNAGYRYFGIEALADTLINIRRFPVLQSGYYTKEPQFANLIRDALDIGFELFGYEASPDKNGKEREIEQAQNIANMVAKHPDSKFLIHCGHDHVIEGTPNIVQWEKAMAGRVKEYTHIDPFTVDQVAYSPMGNPRFNHPYIALAHWPVPAVMVAWTGALLNGEVGKDQVDCKIIHPITREIHGKPIWLMLGARSAHLVSLNKIPEYPALVLAYRIGEFENDGVPVGIIEVTDKNQVRGMFLRKGKYQIVVKNSRYQIVCQYETTVK